MPVRLGLEGGEHRVGRRLRADQHAGATRGAKWEATISPSLSAPGRSPVGLTIAASVAGPAVSALAARGGERFEARGDRDLVVVGEALLDDGMLGEPERQHAEPTRRQPQQRRAALDAALP